MKNLRIKHLIPGFFLFCVIFITAVAAATELTENNASSIPEAEQANISQVLNKDSLTKDDYSFLWEQTGLSKTVIDQLRSKPNGIREIKKAQTILFEPPSFVCKEISGFSKAETIEDKKNFCPVYDLMPGDVLLTKSTHTLCYRHGHSALVIGDGMLAEATAIGNPVSVTDTSKWGGYPSAIQLRITKEAAAKTGMTPEELGEAVSSYAEQNLLGENYHLLAGAFGHGIESGETQCAYLIWEAYQAFGVDVSARSFPVTPASLLNSKQFEVISCRGFDPEKIKEKAGR